MEKRIFGIKASLFNIFLITFCISIDLILIYFINPKNTLFNVSMGIGASLIGAVFLAFLLEFNDNKINNEKIKVFRKEKFNLIKSYLTRAIEMIIRKFYILYYNELDKNKIYALKYSDIKEILINKFIDYDIYNYENNNFNQQTINMYNDGFSILDTIINMVNKIIAQDDLLIINEILSKEEIEKLRTTTVNIPVVNNNSLELTIYNATFVIDQLLDIKEMSELKNYYGIYSVKDHRMSICNDNKKSVITPLNIIFNLDDSIKNGKELINNIKKIN